MGFRHTFICPDILIFDRALEQERKIHTKSLSLCDALGHHRNLISCCESKMLLGSQFRRHKDERERERDQSDNISFSALTDLIGAKWSLWL